MNHVKLISLITAIIVLFGTLTASADMTPANEEQKLITEELSADDTGFFSSSSVSLYSSDSNTIPEKDPIVQEAVSILNSETFENTIVDALNSGKTSINVSDMEIPIYVQTSNAELCSYIYKAAQDKFFDIVYSHPEIIHSVTSVGVSMSYFPGNSTGIISSITTSYLNDLNTNESRTLFNNWCSRIISTLINDDMEDYDKALILHDYLAKTVEYNMNAVSSSNNQLTSVDTHARSAYGAIVDKTAVCQGYALAYAHLLSLVGIESEFVTSDYMNHAWNMVKIDNDFYHVDVTYDDPVNTSNEDAGLVSHEYFLRSDESISSSLSSDQKNGVRSPHYGWSTYDSISCSNSAFDTNLIDNSDDVYSFRRTRQEMKYNDGKYYYIQNSYPIEYAVSYFNGSDLELLNDSSMYDSIDTTVELNAKASPSPTPSIEVQPP
ncbi:MAG: transglutaminase domain-containing protein, partial [Monoglobales bacterium]